MIDGSLAGSGRLRSRCLSMLYWKKELEMLSSIKSSKMKNINDVVDSYSCDGDMATKTSKICFRLGREISTGDTGRTKHKLALIQMQVALNGTSSDKIFRMCAHENIAIYARSWLSMRSMTIMLHYNLAVFKCLVTIMLCKRLMKVPIHQVSYSSILKLRGVWIWPTIPCIMLCSALKSMSFHHVLVFF